MYLTQQIIKIIGFEQRGCGILVDVPKPSMLPKAMGIAAAKGDSGGVWANTRREAWRVFIIRDPRVRLVIWLQIASDEGNAVLD